jgi:hypothetical protein
VVYFPRIQSGPYAQHRASPSLVNPRKKLKLWGWGMGGKN